MKHSVIYIKWYNVAMYRSYEKAWKVNRHSDSNNLCRLSQFAYKKVDIELEYLVDLLPSFESVDAMLYKHRKENIPKLSKSLDEIDLPTAFQQTELKEEYLIVDDYCDGLLLLLLLCVFFLMQKANYKNFRKNNLWEVCFVEKALNFSGTLNFIWTFLSYE